VVRFSGSPERLAFGFGLVGYGVWAALHAFHVVHPTAGAALGMYWPLVFTVWGLAEVVEGLVAQPRRARWMALFVAVVGALLSASNGGLLPGGAHVFWEVVWAAAVVAVGLAVLGTRDTVVLPRGFVIGTGAASGRRRGPHGRGWFTGATGQDSWLGEMHVGQHESWELSDRVYRQGLGTINLDLTHARLPDGETHIIAHVGVGEIEVLLPPDMTVRLNGTVRVGEVRFFGREGSGLDRALDYETPGYEAAPRRLHLEMHSGIGDVTVERVI